MKEFLGRAGGREQRIRIERYRARALVTNPCEAELLERRRKVADVVIEDLEVVQAGRGAIEIPCLDRDVQLSDLPPATGCGRNGPKARSMTEVVES